MADIEDAIGRLREACEIHAFGEESAMVDAADLRAVLDALDKAHHQNIRDEARIAELEAATAGPAKWHPEGPDGRWRPKGPGPEAATALVEVAPPAPTRVWQVTGYLQEPMHGEGSTAREALLWALGESRIEVEVMEEAVFNPVRFELRPWLDGETLGDAEEVVLQAENVESFVWVFPQSK